jgi:hypothetical protein
MNSFDLFAAQCNTHVEDAQAKVEAQLEVMRIEHELSIASINDDFEARLAAFQAKLKA